MPAPILKRALRRGNAAVGEFSSGEDFLSQFQPEAWDVIFIDQYMDGLSGIDTAGKSGRRTSWRRWCLSPQA